jgi:hypothetical protein
VELFENLDPHRCPPGGEKNGDPLILSKGKDGRKRPDRPSPHKKDRPLGTLEEILDLRTMQRETLWRKIFTRGGQGTLRTPLDWEPFPFPGDHDRGEILVSEIRRIFQIPTKDPAGNCSDTAKEFLRNLTLDLKDHRDPICPCDIESGERLKDLRGIGGYCRDRGSATRKGRTCCGKNNRLGRGKVKPLAIGTIEGLKAGKRGLS